MERRAGGRGRGKDRRTKGGEKDGQREGERNSGWQGQRGKLIRQGRREKAERTMDSRCGKAKQAERENRWRKADGQNIENGG